MALRTRCRSGSFSPSRIERSISTEPPSMTRSISLSLSRARSRTIRSSPAQASENGSERTRDLIEQARIAEHGGAQAFEGFVEMAEIVAGLAQHKSGAVGADALAG